MIKYDSFMFNIINYYYHLMFILLHVNLLIPPQRVIHDQCIDYINHLTPWAKALLHEVHPRRKPSTTHSPDSWFTWMSCYSFSHSFSDFVARPWVIPNKIFFIITTENTLPDNTNASDDHRDKNTELWPGESSRVYKNSPQSLINLGLKSWKEIEFFTLIFLP